jgi:hypothetical protein
MDINTSFQLLISMRVCQSLACVELFGGRILLSIVLSTNRISNSTGIHDWPIHGPSPDFRRIHPRMLQWIINSSNSIFHCMINQPATFQVCLQGYHVRWQDCAVSSSPPVFQGCNKFPQNRCDDAAAGKVCIIKHLYSISHLSLLESW